MAAGIVSSSDKPLKNLATPTTFVPLYSGRPMIDRVYTNPPLSVTDPGVMPRGRLRVSIKLSFSFHVMKGAVACLHLKLAVSPTFMVWFAGVSRNVPISDIL